MSMPAETKARDCDLDELLCDLAPAAGASGIRVSGISSDSRRVGSGDLFIATGGERSHGLDYVQDAIRAGAAAVVFDASTADAVPVDVGVPLIAVEGLAGKLGLMVNRYFGSPSERIAVSGVTGTNGKTTVAWLIARCLRDLGVSCGYAGTLGYGVEALTAGDGMTTPDVIEFHRRLADFRDSGASQAAVEVSSHALAQGRVDGLTFEYALFTNLTRDHLDYHGDMSRYGEAKALLFTDCRPRVGIINIDSDFGSRLAERCRGEVVVVSTTPDRAAHGRPHVFVRSVVAREEGSEIDLSGSWGEARLEIAMPGGFNVANAVLVLALLLHQGHPIDAVCRALSGAEAPPGRMQRVGSDRGGPRVYIDYAHTPDALEAALEALRPHCRGRLWCVFGCGGERDRGKRPLMGRVAERLADAVVLTSDNPRGEAPERINAEILAGLLRPADATVINDREAAIAHGIDAAATGDVVLIAGKGHEHQQQLGTGRIDFSDYAIAAARLEAGRTGDAGAKR